MARLTFSTISYGRLGCFPRLEWFVAHLRRWSVAVGHTGRGHLRPERKRRQGELTTEFLGQTERRGLMRIMCQMQKILLSAETLNGQLENSICAENEERQRHQGTL